MELAAESAIELGGVLVNQSKKEVLRKVYLSRWTLSWYFQSNFRSMNPNPLYCQKMLLMILLILKGFPLKVLAQVLEPLSMYLSMKEILPKHTPYQRGLAHQSAE